MSLKLLWDPLLRVEGPGLGWLSEGQHGCQGWLQPCDVLREGVDECRPPARVQSDPFTRPAGRAGA